VNCSCTVSQRRITLSLRFHDLEAYVPRIDLLSLPPRIHHLLGQWLCARQLPRSSDNDIAQRLVTGSSPCRLDLPYNIHTIQHLPEYDVLAIKMRRRSSQNEELRTVGVGTVQKLAKITPAVPHKSSRTQSSPYSTVQDAYASTQNSHHQTSRPQRYSHSPYHRRS